MIFSCGRRTKGWPRVTVLRWMLCIEKWQAGAQMYFNHRESVNYTSQPIWELRSPRLQLIKFTQRCWRQCVCVCVCVWFLLSISTSLHSHINATQTASQKLLNSNKTPEAQTDAQTSSGHLCCRLKESDTKELQSHVLGGSCSASLSLPKTALSVCLSVSQITWTDSHGISRTVDLILLPLRHRAGLASCLAC